MVEPADVLSREDLRRLRSFDLLIDDGWLVLTPQIHQQQLGASVGSSKLPVRILVPTENSIHSLTMPANGERCVLEAEGGVSVREVVGGGPLEVRLEQQGRVKLDGSGAQHITIRTLREPVKGSATPGRLELPATTSVTLVGGDWEMQGRPPRLELLHLVDSCLGLTQAIEVDLLWIEGTCALRGGKVISAALTAEETSILELLAGVAISTQQVKAELLAVGGDGSGRLAVAEGALRLDASRLSSLDLGDIDQGVVDVKRTSVSVQSARDLFVSCGALHLNGDCLSLSGVVETLSVQPNTTVTFEASALIEEFGNVADTELHGVNPYRLRLADLQRLDEARLVTFSFEDLRQHAKQMKWQRDERLDGNESALVLWYRISALLERHGGTGRDRAVARRTEHEFRRWSLAKGEGPKATERRWLAAYRFVGYGDNAILPIVWHAVLCLVLMMVITWRKIASAPGASWAVYWRLILQPARFLLRDEETLKFGTGAASAGFRLPRGLWSVFAPGLAQLFGVLLLAASVNAVRRLVKAR